MTGRQRRARDAGSITLELTLVTPVIIFVILGTIVFAGRVVDARSDIASAAGDGARAASIQRSQQAALQAAEQAVQDTLNNEGVNCRDQENLTSVAFDGGFERGSYVTVTIECTVNAGDLSFHAIPGQMTISTSASEIIDEHRSAG